MRRTPRATLFLAALASAVAIAVVVRLSRGDDRPDNDLPTTTPAVANGAAEDAARRAVPRIEPETNPSATPESAPTSAPSMADRPPGKPGGATLEVTAVWKSDQRPAEAIWIMVYSSDATIPIDENRRGRTSEAGVVRFDKMTAGRTTVSADRGGHGFVDVAAGSATRFRLELEDRVTVDGIVVDRDDRPIADAEISVHDTFDERIAARTGGDGRFRLAGMSEFRTISARGGGFAPSPRRYVRGKNGDIMSMRIVLETASAAVSGRVVDDRGDPVAEASVQIGEALGLQTKIGPGEHGITPPPTTALCDADGRFRIDHLPLGNLPVLIRARGFGPKVDRVVAASTPQSPVEFRLARGVTVVGRVTFGDGRPVIRADLGAGVDLRRPSLTTLTDSDGRFRIEDLPASFEISVEKGNEGAAKTAFVAAPGDVIEWNPVLAIGAVIRGRLVDADDRPLEDWMIQIVPLARTTPWRGQTVTDASGAFVVRNCPVDLDLGLEVREPKNWSDRPAKSVAPLRPDGPEILVRVDATDRLSVRLRGRVVNSNGAGVGGSIVIYEESSRSGAGFDVAPDGTIDLGPFPAHPIELVFRPANTDRSVSLGRYAPAPNEIVDLGVIELKVPGRLSIQVNGTDLRTDSRTWSLGIVQGRMRVDLKLNGDRLLSDEAQPGVYELRFLDGSKSVLLRTVEITSGQTSEISIDWPQLPLR